MKIRVGVIPAAGEGIRAYPKATYMSKVMFKIAGKPIIQRNIEIMKDLGIKEIYVIIGYKGGVIKNFLGDGSKFNVNIKYIYCKNPSIGLARGLFLAKNYVNENFLTILGDEVYINSNHQIIKNFDKKNFSAVCGVMKTNDSRMISKNYAVEISKGLIKSLVEKPKDIKNDSLGVGTYIFTPKIFEAIEKTSPSKVSGRVELTDAINNLAKTEKNVFPIFLEGVYQNINSMEDYNYANYLYRSIFFNKSKISVIIPAYNEESSIARVIKDFIDKVDDVFVVDNSSNDRTKEIALENGARVDTVCLKGYGDTITYGLNNSRGDILIVVEADNSFRAKDLDKILEYMKDADMVIGTRTTRQMIEQGANMNWFLRWGNVAIGKFVEILWWKQEPRFTDVGCTYRGIWKDAWYNMRNRIIGKGPEFSPEMMIEALRSRMRIIEIPVSYYNRYGGESKHSAGFKKIKTGLKMIRLILRKRFLG